MGRPRLEYVFPCPLPLRVHAAQASLPFPGHVSWISKALKQALELAPPSLKISVQIYVTAGEPPATSEKAYDDDSVHNDASGSDEKGSDRKSTRLNSSHSGESRMPSSA